MKKTIFFILAAVMLSMTCACSAASNTYGIAGENSPGVSAGASLTAPADTPSPSKPQGVEAVFGKQVKIAVLANGGTADSALFFEGVQKEASSLGIQVETEVCGDDLDAAAARYAASGIDAAIVFLAEPLKSYAALDAFNREGIPLTLFEMQKGAAPEVFSKTWFNPETQAGMALDAALVYPPHSEPVRLILMFESKDTPAYDEYAKLNKEGRIFPKELYVASAKDQAKPKDWFSKVLKKYYEGMIDGVFAENGEFAAGALQALGKRTDMEVFGIGISAGVLKSMRENPEVFVQATGANTCFAGVLNARIAAAMIKGLKPVSKEFYPVMVHASDLAGNDDAAALIKLSPAADALQYNEAWMEELRNFYAQQ